MPIDPTQTLGFKNQNPLNMRPLGGGQMWHGQSGVANGFCAFVDVRWCFRAWLMQAHSYVAFWDCRVAYDFTKHYAPPEDDNDPVAYALSIEKYMGIAHNTPIIVDRDKLPFCKAQMNVEIGGVPYADDVILEGFSWVGNR